MLMKKCPIYDSTNACTENPNCLFLRQGGCTLILSATIAEDNQKKLIQLERKIDELDYMIRNIANAMQAK